jgi:hypothetical protein
MYGCGIPVYSTVECAEKYEGVQALRNRMGYKCGGFTIIPLLVPHNVECYSYVIDLPFGGGRMLFITDASDFPYKIPNVNFICIETNYCESRLIDNFCDGGVRSMPENHMGLETAIEVVKRHYSPALSKVICLHLSDANSDENEIKTRFYEELGIHVDIAEPNAKFRLEKDEF